MSQNQKIGLIIVGAALALVSIIAVKIYLDKTKLAAAKVNVENMLAKSKSEGVKKDQDIKELNERIQSVTAEKTKLESEKAKVEQDLEKVRQKVDSLAEQLKKTEEEKAQWEKRAGDIKTERDKLTARVSELNQQIEELKNQEPEPAQPGMSKAAKPKPSSDAKDEIVSSSDTQWAGVLKDKAGLEVDLDRLRAELSQASQDLIDIRQKNEELQVSMDSLTEQKASMDREIKYKTDLVNNLSLDLARAKNDQRLKEERIKELDNENQELRKRIKDLVSANGSLEKSMVRLNQDKRMVEKKLDTTEDLIHSKINEIWDIKSSIDQTMKGSRAHSGGDIELPPIMVNNQLAGSPSTESSGFNGSVASVNRENNFVIVNIGQRNGLAVGDSLGVYRGTQYIGQVEVIQVRSDIAAADIKEQSMPIQTGDTVK